MKNWQIAAVLTFLIMGTVIMSGCISPGSTGVTPVATPTPTSSPTPALKTVLFSDDLSQWRSEWQSVYDYSDGKTFYSGGSLHIRDIDPPTASMYHTLNKNFNDFILDVDIKAVAGIIDNWQGVSVRRQDEDNYYDFSISADGYYTILKLENSITKNLIGGPTPSSYINKGIGATNHIQVEANKNTLSLSVNGHHLSTVTDNAFKEGTVLLKANSKPSNSFTEVAFSNLVITTI